MYWFSRSVLPGIYVGVFAGLLFFVAVAAGTRRRWLLAIAALSSLGISWAMSFRYSFEGISERTLYHRPGVPKLPFEGDFHEGLLQILTPAVVTFAVSFALSFFLDWFLNPVGGSESTVGEPPAQSKKKTSRFKLLALMAVPLFLVQMSINASNGASWMAVVILVLTGFAVSYRLSFWKGLLALIAFAIAIMFVSVQVIAIRMSGDVRSSVSAMLMAGILATLIPVWFLVGNNRKKNKKQIGMPVLLTGLACLLFGSFAWIYHKYDSAFLFFGPYPFDFAVAKSIRNIDSHPNVRAKVDLHYGVRASCNVTFESDEDVSDFFKTHSLPDIGMELEVSSMPETVDLSPLEQLLIKSLNFSDCSLSSSQLVALTNLHNAGGLFSIGFTDCDFIPEDVDWPANSKPRFSLINTNGSQSRFFEAIEGLDELELYIRAAESYDASVVAESLKAKGNGMTLTVGGDSQALAAAVADVESLSNVTFENVVLEVNQKPVKPFLDLVFNSKAIVRALPVQSEQLFWDLVIAGADQRLTVGDWNSEPGCHPELLKDLDSQKIRDFHWVYDNSQASEPISKLFLPLRRRETVSALAKFPKLKSLSFDKAWSNGSFFFKVDDAEIDLKPIKGIVQLKELYMPRRGAGHDLNLLAGQESLETLQFTASSRGFHESLFPNLKHVILIVDMAILEQDLLKRLAALKHLEKLTLVTGHVYMSQSAVANPKRLKKACEGALPAVEVVALRPYKEYLPDDFKEHCERVREHCREKYLK